MMCTIIMPAQRPCGSTPARRQAASRRCRPAPAHPHLLPWLAEKADLSVNYVGDLERGVKTPSLDTFIRIVEALDVPADVLIRDSAAPASYVADDELNRKLSRLTPGQKKAATDILNAYIDNIPYIKEK